MKGNFANTNFYNYNYIESSGFERTIGTGYDEEKVKEEIGKAVDEATGDKIKDTVEEIASEKYVKKDGAPENLDEMKEVANAITELQDTEGFTEEEINSWLK